MSNETEKMAVELFAERLNSDEIFNFEKIIEKYKEIQKEQMIKTALFWSHSTVTRQNVIDYIDETYGGNK